MPDQPTFYTSLFAQRQLKLETLIPFGFKAQSDTDYCWSTLILADQFQLNVTLKTTNTVQTELIDTETHAVYPLYLDSTATGAFVSQVRQAVLEQLTLIADTCFTPASLFSPQAQTLIAYADHHYGDQLEFLWPKFPKNAVIRRSDSQKWYLLLMSVNATKLGLPMDTSITIIDIHLPADQIAQLVDHRHFFPGYHMNKKYWLTVVLDNQVPFATLTELLQTSYQLAQK